MEKIIEMLKEVEKEIAEKSGIYGVTFTSGKPSIHVSCSKFFEMGEFGYKVRTDDNFSMHLEKEVDGVTFTAVILKS